jgi:2-succinyl-6-hydroxy-2,4-cyclohexadiene-1-carboxylate synthase
MGYSMGARLALFLAVRHPERVHRLVLESGSPGLATEEERGARRASDGALADELEREGIEAFVAGWETLPLFEGFRKRLSAEERAAVRERRLANDPGLLAATLRGLGTGSLPSLWDDLTSLPHPVLLVAGEEDGRFVEIARAMAGRLGDATLRVVPEAGHTVHLEQPASWLVAVREFLTGA